MFFSVHFKQVSNMSESRYVYQVNAIVALYIHVDDLVQVTMDYLPDENSKQWIYEVMLHFVEQRHTRCIKVLCNACKGYSFKNVWLELVKLKHFPKFYICRHCRNAWIRVTSNGNIGVFLLHDLIYTDKLPQNCGTFLNAYWKLNQIFKEE